MASDPVRDEVGHAVLGVEVGLHGGVLDLDIDRQVCKCIERFIQGWNLGMSSPEIVEAVVDQRAHLSDVGVVVEYHNIIGREPDVELDTVGAMGHGQLKCLDAVVGRMRRRTAMSEDEGASSAAGIRHVCLPAGVVQR